MCSIPLITQEVHFQTTMKQNLGVWQRIIKKNACALAVAMAIHMVSRERNMETAQNLLVELLPDSQTSCLAMRQREPKSRPWQSVYDLVFLVVLLILSKV